MSSPGLAGLSMVQNAAGQFATKTITFTGATGAGSIGSVALFTTTGGVVVIDDIVGRVTTSLTGATAAIQLGTTSVAAAFIASTVATTLTTTANLWASATATAGAIAVPAALAQGIYTVENVIITVGTANVTGGVLEVNCVWHPLTPGATVT